MIESLLSPLEVTLLLKALADGLSRCCLGIELSSWLLLLIELAFICREVPKFQSKSYVLPPVGPRKLPSNLDAASEKSRNKGDHYREIFSPWYFVFVLDQPYEHEVRHPEANGIDYRKEKHPRFET